MTSPTIIPLSVGLVQSIVNYLQTRPYSEVVALMTEIYKEDAEYTVALNAAKPKGARVK